VSIIAAKKGGAQSTGGKGRSEGIRGRGGGIRGRGGESKGLTWRQVEQPYNQGAIPGNYTGPSRSDMIVGKDSANAVPLGQMYGGHASYLLPTPEFSSRHPTQGSRAGYSGANPYSNTTPRYGPQGVGTSYGGLEGNEGVSTGRGVSWNQGQSMSNRGRSGKKKTKGRGRDEYSLRGPRHSTSYSGVRGVGVV